MNQNFQKGFFAPAAEQNMIEFFVIVNVKSVRFDTTDTLTGDEPFNTWMTNGGLAKRRQQMNTINVNTSVRNGGLPIISNLDNVFVFIL